jgi:lipid-binding SYLF domain-containing protein
MAAMRRRRFLSGLAAVALLTPGFASLRAQADSDEARRLHEAGVVFDEVMQADDAAIPKGILEKAEAIAVFPSVVKAGFFLGGMRGRGVISARTEHGWSAPAFMTLTGGSIGLQIGGQAVDLVLVVNSRRGLEHLLGNQFKLGVDGSVAAGPVGRNAEASTDLQMRAEILSYSRARGLFAGVTINGSTVKNDRDAAGRFYGAPMSATDIVLDGRVTRPPSGVADWQRVLVHYASR